MSGGALEASVTLDELCAVLGTKRVPMAPELAGYLVLEVAEHADPLAGEIDPKSVYVGEEGTVALVQPKRDNRTGDAEGSVRAALARLLEASGSQTPALAAASKRAGGAGLRALVTELEAALIPVNRAAGRRALARLAREAKRATLGLGRHTLPSSSELNTRLGSRTVPAPVEHAPESRPTPSTNANVEALVAQFSVSGPGEPGQSRELRAIAGIVAETPPPPLATVGGAPPDEETRPLPSVNDVTAIALPEDDDELGSLGASRPPSSSPAESSESPAPANHSTREDRAAGTPVPPRSRTIQGVLVAIVFVGVAAGAGIAARLFRGTATQPSQILPNSPPNQASAPMAPSPCRGLIVITDVPRHAEVLFRVGQAPVDVERMPVGARLEFVATADSHVPKRLVVPSEAIWTAGPDRVPRYTASVELEHSHARPGVIDPWPSGEPGSEVGGQGPPGTVHIVVSPVGAEVWMLSGLGPEARMEASCDRATDILVAGPTTFRKQIHVSSGDFVTEPAGSGPSNNGPLHIARMSAK
jgi:hypothetical protein